MPRRHAFRSAGDWSQFKNALNLSGWGGARTCWMCKAGREHHHRDPSLGASWRNTLFTHEEWLRDQAIRQQELSKVWSSKHFPVVLRGGFYACG